MMTPIEKELHKILVRDGILNPVAVVEYARDVHTALHNEFEWDDTEAAHQHRLWQARQVIRVHVTVLKNEEKPVRAFVSLQSDRNADGGYRPIQAVLENKEMLDELLAMALKDLIRIKSKYGHLKKLAGVWGEIDKVQQKIAAEKTVVSKPSNN